MCTIANPFTPSTGVGGEATTTAVRIKDGTTIKAECTLAPTMSVSQASLDFGSLADGGGPITRSVDVSNGGNVPLTFQASLSVNGTGQTFVPKTPAALGSFTLPPEAKQTFEIDFKPSGASTGTQTGSLVLDPRPVLALQNVYLTGVVTSTGTPDWMVSSGPLIFGPTEVGTSSAFQSVTIKNTGTASLTFSAAIANDPSSNAPGPLFKSSAALPSGAILNIGQTKTIDIAFAPPFGTSLGLQKGFLTITSDTNPPPAVNPVELKGTTTLPNPIIALGAIEHYSTPQGRWVRYRVPVTNWQAYPSELFAAAPDLPPCGLNTKSARTWVYIHDLATGRALYGFCALGSPTNLQNIWFAVREGTAPPAMVYVVFLDRRTNMNYISNSIATH